MASLASPTRTTVIPSLGYRDAGAAVEWLCRVFGFEPHFVGRLQSGVVARAELSFGNGLIMIHAIPEPDKQTDWHRLTRHPDEVGGVETQSTVLVVTDADAMYARARAAGAEIAYDIRDSVAESREFSCRDLEGRLWNFVTYDPWAAR